MSGFGGAIKLTGESEYKKALASINQTLRETASEMRMVSSAYDKGDKSEASVTAQTEVLNKQLDQQTQKLNVLKAQYDTMSQKYAEQAQKHSDLVDEYDTERNKLEEIGRTMGESSSEYQQQKEVVDKLAKEVEKSTKAQDENEKSMSKMRTQINDAQTACNKTSKAMDDLSVGAESAGTGAEKAGQGFTIMKGILAELGADAIRAVVSGLKQLGEAFVDVGKQAIEGYASFEQLEGGVQKIFGKDMAKTVAQNAQNAFSTAGMSANEYMETITGFSSSLIQSLDGDTAKATEVADRAIRDMSDNANTFGTDMSTLQSAYQNFAKQNYTMLDSLKIGYGGSKEEMQRLLQDASKLTDVQKELGVTVDANDMSFANIANAISVVQSNMGIMGTTAKEASGTIEGSTNAMKSAWQNMLVGMADENADFTTLAENFVSTLITDDGQGGVLGTIIPRIGTVIDGMATAISDGVPMIVQKVMPLIQSQIPVIVSALQNVLTAVLNTLPQIMPVIADLIPQIVTTLINLLPQIINVGIEFITSLINGIAKALPTLIQQMPRIVILLAKTLIKNLPKIIQAGVALIKAIITGIGKNISSLGKIGARIITTVANAVKSGVSKMLSVGKNLVEGIWSGISNGLGWIKSKIKGWVGNVTSFIKNLFGISSPSKVMRDEVGKNLALGIGVGFSDEMKRVSQEMGDAIPTDFDVNPSVSGARYIDQENDMVGAFKQALSEMKIVLDDEVAGRFVDKTVTKLIYT